jgi:hypothetical protein
MAMHTYFQRTLLVAFLCLMSLASIASHILIPMDDSQKNHLKAYGIAYWILQNDIEVEWLLNYRGGSFLIKDYKDVEEECVIRGVSYQILADVQAIQILNEIADPEANMETVKLEKAPKIAVYSPKSKLPWDDAVTLVMTYAEIPYEIIYDQEIIQGKLPTYDWVHLHHEDFTGQYGKFYASYKNAIWYQQQVKDQEAIATILGFTKVSELKKAVVTNISNYVAGGGYLFTMCSGTDSFDITRAAMSADICESMYDGDPADPNAQAKLEFHQCFAFEDFTLVKNPLQYEFSDIDGTDIHNKVGQQNDFFFLFDFSAKWDVVPTMLCQNHTQVVKGFMGQTTSFRRNLIKSSTLIMGESPKQGTAKYVHGEFGVGQWTFYGGHDPEDYTHRVNDPPTDLNLFPNSAGYRLILNNILFPAAKKKKQKT